LAQWLLVDRLPPEGAQRRGAVAPIVPLARLDGSGAPARLRAARDQRADTVDPRTLNRELSILRGAIAWWASLGWLDRDHGSALTASVVSVVEESGAGLDQPSVAAVFALRATLREQAFWQLLYESAAPIEHLLALDISDLDLVRRTTRRRPGSGPLPQPTWRAGAAKLLPLLLAGRYSGPVFLTDRRVPAGSAEADRCKATGRARLSYRRAAELFQAATAPLDPAGRGWPLRRLRLAGKRENEQRAAAKQG
jgi:integrase